MHKGKSYSHLSKEERAQIKVLLEADKSKREIARLLDRHPSTIGRELRRNTPKRGVGAKKYCEVIAQRRCIVRHKTKRKAIKFNEPMKAVTRILLSREKWSPELISAKLREMIPEFVSHEWIYQWIWKCKRSNRRKDKPDKELYRFLRHGKRRRHRGNRRDNRGIIPARVMIDQRPDIINQRRRNGDMEADLVLGKNHQPGLIILQDRKNRLVQLERIRSKRTQEIKSKIEQMNERSPIKFKSITFDNDQAFASHLEIADSLKIKTFFTHPYSSQEKGSVENRIGILRRFFPKKTDFNLVSDLEIKNVEHLLNNRPLRMFNYKSPIEVLTKGRFALIT